MDNKITGIKYYSTRPMHEFPNPDDVRAILNNGDIAIIKEQYSEHVYILTKQSTMGWSRIDNFNFITDRKDDHTNINEMTKMEEIDAILTSNMSDDLKLFEIFEIYKNILRKSHTGLYYALLGWKDSHLKDLLKEKGDTNKYTAQGNSVGIARHLI